MFLWPASKIYLKFSFPSPLLPANPKTLSPLPQNLPTPLPHYLHSSWQSYGMSQSIKQIATSLLKVLKQLLFRVIIKSKFLLWPSNVSINWPLPTWVTESPSVLPCLLTVSAHWPFPSSHRPCLSPPPPPGHFTCCALCPAHLYPIWPWLASVIIQRWAAWTHSSRLTPPSLSVLALFSFIGILAPWQVTKSWCLSCPEWHSQNQAQASGEPNSNAGTFMRADCLPAPGPHNSLTRVLIV